MKVFVTLYFWGVFLLTSPLAVLLLSTVVGVTAPFDARRGWVHLFLSRWTYSYLLINPAWKVRVTGRENLPQGACVLVANHQSMSDVFVLMGLFHPFKFVSKASLFRLPVVGWVMAWAKYVALERGSTRSTQRMFESCRQWLQKDMAVLIFPEGTYSSSGLLPFKRGAFRLAIEEKVPVVPVVLHGTRSLVVGDGPWLSPTCRIEVKVLPKVDVSQLGEDDQALAKRVRALFEDALAGG